MRCAVCVAWRDSGDWDRRAAWSFVKPYYERAFEVVAADSGHDPFSRSASFNLAVRRAQADVVLLVGADTILRAPGVRLGDHSLLRHAFRLAGDTGQMVIPHDRYVRLTKEATRGVLEGGPLVQRSNSVNYVQTAQPVTGGVVVVPARQFLDMDGLDGRFIGWGYEDTAFSLAWQTVYGPAVRLPGEMWHLWHEEHGPVAPASEALYNRYAAADGDRAAMLEVLQR